MVKINFKGLIAQWKNRYRLLPVSGAANLYDLVPERGTVTQEGDEITAEAMNQLQANVEQAIDDLQESVAQDMADLEVASGEALKQAQLEADTRYSNALTGTASGAMAHMTDVSGIGSLRRLAVLGETAEAGTGDKGPDNPYAVAGLTPTKIMVSGGNLIGIEDPYHIEATVTSYGGTVQRYNNGVTLSATGAISQTYAAERYWYPIAPGTYTLRAKMDTTDTGYTPLLMTSYGETLTGGRSGLGSMTASGSMTIIIPKSGYFGMYLMLTGDSASTAARTVRYYDIQLEPGNTATAYEPYTGATVTLPTLEPLYGDGTINDEYDAATGIETRQWKRRELDGTEAWSTRTSGADVYGYQLPNFFDAAGADGICSHFEYLKNAATGATNTVCIASSSTYTTLCIYIDTISTVDGLKSWLAAQKAAGTPVAVVYQLATPEAVQHDPARVIPPAPVCNVYADQGDVDVTYNRDINIVLSQMQAAIIASGGNINV